MLAILFIICQIGHNFAASTLPGNSCGLIKFKGSSYVKEFTSPGYPGLFAPQTQCTWLIVVDKPYRVKLKIQDFFLIPDARCEGQYVTFHDDFTNHIYGPFCGRRRSEEIISAGNKVRIKLESDLTTTSRYRGFKLLYSRTNEEPTSSMKDKLGKWKFYTKSRMPTSTATPRRVTDSIVDTNGNAEINRRNQAENEKHDKESQIKTIDNFISVTETMLRPIIRTQRPQRAQRPQRIRKPTTLPPSRWSPPNRVIMNPKIYRTKRPPTRLEEIDPGDGGNTLTLKYLAIVFSILLGIGIFIVIFIKMRRKKKAKKRSNQNNNKLSNTVDESVMKHEGLNTDDNSLASGTVQSKMHIAEDFLERGLNFSRPEENKLPVKEMSTRSVESIPSNGKFAGRIYHRPKEVSVTNKNTIERTRRKRGDTQELVAVNNNNISNEPRNVQDEVRHGQNRKEKVVQIKNDSVPEIDRKQKRSRHRKQRDNTRIIRQKDFKVQAKGEMQKSSKVANSRGNTKMMRRREAEKRRRRNDRRRTYNSNPP